MRLGEGFDTGAAHVAQYFGATAARDLAENTRIVGPHQIGATGEEQRDRDGGDEHGEREEHDGDAAGPRTDRRNEVDFDERGLASGRRGLDEGLDENLDLAFGSEGVHGLVRERRQRRGSERGAHDLGLRLDPDEGRASARKNRRDGVRPFFVPHQGIGLLVAERWTSGGSARQRGVVDLHETREPTNANARNR